MFDFGTLNWNHVTDGQDDIFFTDSKIMYDTMQETFEVVDFDSTKNFISNKTKFQKIKIYNRFLKHLSMFKRLGTERTSKSRVRTALSENAKYQNARFLDLKVKNEWNLFTQFFNATGNLTMKEQSQPIQKRKTFRGPVETLF